MADHWPVVVRTADFIREFGKLAPHRHRYEVLRGFVHMSAFSLANAWPYTRSEAIEAEFESGHPILHPRVQLLFPAFVTFTPLSKYINQSLA
jgi:hypothetical protein